MQGHGDGHQVGHLYVVAAAVRRSRRFVGAGMIAADQGVQLAEDGDGTIRFRPLHAAFYAVDAPAVRIGNAQFIEGFLYLSRRLIFLISQFRFGEDRFAEGLYVVETLFNGFAHCFL